MQHFENMRGNPGQSQLGMGRIADVGGIEAVQDARLFAFPGGDDLFFDPALQIGEQLAQGFKIGFAGDVQFVDAEFFMQRRLQRRVDDVGVVSVAQNGFAQGCRFFGGHRADPLQMMCSPGGRFGARRRYLLLVPEFYQGIPARATRRGRQPQRFAPHLRAQGVSPAVSERPIRP